MAKNILFGSPQDDPSGVYNPLPQPVEVTLQEGRYSGGGARAPGAAPPDSPINRLKGNLDMRFADMPPRATQAGLPPYVGLKKGPTDV